MYLESNNHYALYVVVRLINFYLKVHAPGGLLNVFSSD